jgi:hypothetical protein
MIMTAWRDFMLRAGAPATPTHLHALKLWPDHVPRRLALEAAGALVESFPDPAQVTGVSWHGRILAGGQLHAFVTDELAALCSLLETVQRRVALEAAGACIESFPDPAKVTGIRWEGTALAAGQSYVFEAAELVDLCTWMETVVTLGRVSCAAKALPVPTPQSVTWACGSAEPVSRLPTRSPR